MIKKLFGFFVAFVLVVVLAAVFFGKTIFAGALQAALGSPVKIGSLKIGFSELAIRDLSIGNPQGFQEKNLAVIPEVSVRFRAGELFKGKVHLEQIVIRMAEATVEKSSAGKINLLELKALKKPEAKKPEPSAKPSEESQPQKPAPAPEKKPVLPVEIQIDEVLLHLGSVRYVDSAAVPPSVKEYPLGVRNESFRNVTNIPELVKQLAFFILKKVGMSSLTSNFDVLLKGLGGELGSTVGKWMEKLNNL